MLLSVSVALTLLAAQAEEPPAEKRTDLPPLMERYLLDELKSLRTEMHNTRTEMLREIQQRELSVAERALNYSMNTVTYFFYVVAAAAAIMALIGWQSFRELKASAKVVADSEVARLTAEYQKRFETLEEQLREKSEAIFENQREIEKTQRIHSLWLQANQSVSPRTKIDIYDQILALSPGDAEVLAYKAKAAMDLGDKDWALSLCNQILDDNDHNSLGYYHRACANAALGLTDAAIQDLKQAVELSEALRQQAAFDDNLANLRSAEEFQQLIHGYVPDIATKTAE